MCDECAVKLLKSTVKTIGVIVGSLCIYLFFPIIAFVFEHDLQLPIPVLLPFTDLQSANGILLNLLNQIFMDFIGMAGNIGIEIITCLLKNSVWASVLIICSSIDEFFDLEKFKSLSNTTIDYKFRNILIQIQDLDR